MRPELLRATLPTSSPQSREPEYGRSWGNNEIPQQLHVSKLPSKSLSLGPGQVAIVPVTFLPRYPSANDDEEGNGGVSNSHDTDSKNSDDFDSTAVGDGRSPSPLSSTAKLDLVDLVGERVLKVIDNKRQYLRHSLNPTYRRRNNMDELPKGDEQYDVSTTVVVDTSRGVVKLPISASSIRDNLYRIPDVIKFHHPSVTGNDDHSDDLVEDDDEVDNYDIICNSSTQSCETTTTEAHKRIPRNVNRGPRLTSMDGAVILDTIHTTDSHDHAEEESHRASVLDTIKPRECFDLYLSNPFLDRELQVMEALVSRPEFVSIQFDPGRMAAPDLTMLVGSGPSQVVRQWTEDGPLYLPPESDNHYVLSICTAFEGEIDRDEGSETYLDEMSKWIDSGDPTRNLGFLQIRTDAETLFIGLEHTDNAHFLLGNTGSSSGGGLQTSSSNAYSSSHAPTTNSSIGESFLLKSFPDRLDLKMISTTSPTTSITFGLQNKSPVPIRIMRVTVGMDSAGNKENAREMKLIGLELSIGVKSSNMNERGDGNKSEDETINEQFDSFILGAATSLDNILELTCSLKPDRFFSDSSKEAFHFNGTVIIRGTMDTELSYNQWREETLRNPFRDEHLTVELPLKISILNGRVEALIERSSHPYPQLFAAQSWDGSGRAVSHLFFPMNQYATVEGTEDFLPQQMYVGANEIRHDLRILSNMVLPLRIVGAKIVDEDSNQNDSLCNRFNVSTSPRTIPNESYLGFEEIGLLLLKYKFETKGKKGDKYRDSFSHNIDPHLPKRCSMVVKTNREEAGLFKIPLLIFPGRLEVSSDEASAIGDSGESKAIMGFGHLLSWCRSSRLGMSFIETLQNTFEDRRKTKSDYRVLSKYISDISRWDPKLRPNFLPILLKIGAIDSGKISKMHIYLTNHNPIPLTVSIGVGEVEGMSITLSRDASKATGDGNSLLDHLPEYSRGTLVKSGKYQDHPVTGLLDFLKSNDQAIEFISKFRFRDSLTSHDAAIQRSDVLQLLHDWHSKAFFHRDPVSSQPSSKNSSKCNESAHPPVYSSFNGFSEGTKLDGYSGPFMFSNDIRLARPLSECWRRDPVKMSSDKDAIKIPPGARARFEVQIRAPPKEYLEDDINNILMSGLMLSTNLGDVMPIFVIVEALQGRLYASDAESFESKDMNVPQELISVEQSKRKIMNVPLELNWNSHEDFKTPANFTQAENFEPTISHFYESSDHGIPLYLRSSFTRNVSLLNVDSCNPWFKFVPLESSSTPELSSNAGTLVGFIRTNVNCSLKKSTENRYPSFHQCVLNWLSNRLELQPDGCGMKESNPKLRQIDNVKRTLEMGLRRLKKRYKSYVTSHDKSYVTPHEISPQTPHLYLNESDLSHIKTGRRANNGLISNLPSYDAIRKALKIANDFEYNLLSSSLKATVEYDSETSNQGKEESYNASTKQNLSLSIHDIDVQSILKEPKLFESASNYLEFKPTIIGSVANSVIAVRNPTGVPVRIRIGIVHMNLSDRNKLRGSSDNSHSYSDDERLLENIQNPYVQSGLNNIPRNESASHSWWESNGSFFIANEQGDVIRSHSNISVTGGGGTTSISLVNPSLNAQVGFLVGCGKRCGLRDTSADLSNPISSSPIGASAASGIILKGNFRYNSPESNDKQSEEPIILAGGTSVSIDNGPSAFAIPFHALDEIVIPPFGKGTLGPIYFRPPGRYKTIGCDVAKQSGARLERKKKALCKSQSFDSVLYLENSLTGIEEVELRGKSAWDHLYFLDPPPKEGEDAFGDIEFRDGMPTLVFSGTSNTFIDTVTKHSLFGKRTQRLSVVKEIILQNGGDTPSEIIAVSIFGTGTHGKRGGPCSHGSFKLLNCWEAAMPTNANIDLVNANVHSGFVLKPGTNRSIFVEHVPDCRTKNEFVTLHVKLKDGSSNIISNPRRSRTRRTENQFGRKQISMLLGYEMDASSFSRCMPVDTRLASSVIHTDLANMNLANYSSRVESKSFGNSQEESSVLLFQIFLFSAAALVLCYALRARFHAILAMLQKIQGEPTKNDRNWNAAFRCLARSHPTSAELQTMSREQMRQDVMGRYKAKGNAPSSSLNYANGFSRDRRTTISKTLRHRAGKEGSAGNERTRPFSEALFHDTSVTDDSSLRIHFPVGLGWRTAYSRGLIKDNSLQFNSFDSRTRNLLRRRAELAFENDKKNEKEEKNQESQVSVKLQSSRSDLKPKPSPPFINPDESNGTNNEVDKNEAIETKSTIAKTKTEETKSNNDEINDPTGNEWNKKSKTTSGRRVAQVRKGVGIAASTERKETSRKQENRAEKSIKPNDINAIKSKKNANSSEVSKRIQNSRNNQHKTSENQDLNKIPKNAQWGQGQKVGVPAKSTPSPKGSSVNAWQGGRQKLSTKTLPKKDTTVAEKKSKGKDKNKKKTTKQSAQGEKSAVNSTNQTSLVSETSKEAETVVSGTKPQPVLSPPPGFGAPQTNTPVSPSAITRLHPVSSTDSQLSLDTMLHQTRTGSSNEADLSLGVASQASTAQLAFPHANDGANDLLFKGSMLESKPSPKVRGFNISDVGVSAENSTALASSGDQPWLPPLINEDSELVEQPWLPALRNEDAESAFDVMDFLDGILQDGSNSNTEVESTLDVEPSIPGTPRRMVMEAAGNTSSTPVSANPWAKESRAAAYGISFDDEENKSAKSSTPGLEEILNRSSIDTAIPGNLGGNANMLTPATFFNDKEDNDLAVEEDDKEISFYAGLLDE